MLIWVAAAILVVGGAAYWLYTWMQKPRYFPGTLKSKPPPSISVNQSGTKLVTDDKVELHTFSDGEGVRVLFVHGGPAHPPVSVPEGLKGLLSTCQLHFYHLRGCGYSSRPILGFDKEKQSGRYYGENADKLMKALGMEAQLQDIERMRQFLQQDKIILMGHSWGGFLATMYACEYPERVKALILVAPGNVLVTSDGLFGIVKSRLPESRKAEFAKFMATYLDFSPKIFSRSEKDMQDINNEVASWYEEALNWKSTLTEKDKELTGGFMTHAMYFGIGAKRDYRPYIKKINAPTLVIHGENDPCQTKKETAVYSEGIPTAKLVAITGGHFLFNDNPKEFEKVVANFLKQLPK